MPLRETVAHCYLQIYEIFKDFYSCIKSSSKRLALKSNHFLYAPVFHDDALHFVQENSMINLSALRQIWSAK